MALTHDTSRFNYKMLLWGDLIYGSKAELQALGIGRGMSFPGEPGGNKRRMYCTDPRGFRCRIDRERWADDYYSCSIPFPDRSAHDPEPPAVEVAPGVLLSTSGIWWDEFVGSEEALIAAGLMRPGQFPGKPGMRKLIVTILPDGSVFDGPRTANKPVDARAPGSKRVHKGPGTLYRVLVHLQEDESERRSQKARAREREIEAQLMAMPRPRPLVTPNRETEALRRRQGIRLVWSRPAPGFSIPD